MASFTLQELNDELPKKWEVISELGAGGQGSVYRGAISEIPVAIKVFHRDDDGRITRELEAASQLSSDYVCTVKAWCSIGLKGQSVMVVAYELHDGGDLESWVGADPLKTQRELASLGRDVACGIRDLWSVKMVHRDIKPANIVISCDGKCVLVDLAFARHLDRSSLTASGYTCGTRPYFSPEQSLAWKELTYASDVYTLGVTMFQIATGRFPSSSEVQGGLVGRSLAESRPDLSEIADVLDGMMIMRPYERTRPLELIRVFHSIAEA